MFLEEIIFNVDNTRRLYLPPILRNEKGQVVLTYIDQDTLVISNSEDFNVEKFLVNINDRRLKRKFIRYISSSSFLLNIDSKGMIVMPTYIFKKFSFFSECVILKIRFGFVIKNKVKYLEEKENVHRKKLEY